MDSQIEELEHYKKLYHDQANSNQALTLELFNSAQLIRQQQTIIDALRRDVQALTKEKDELIQELDNTKALAEEGVLRPQ